MIENHQYEGPGFKPLLISEGWQVAHLNFLKDLGFDKISRVERHHKTDEAFVLITGASVLLALEETSSGTRFFLQKMAPGIIYNIPRGTWHWIFMSEADRVVIVEKSNTHENDVEYRQLLPEEAAAVREALPVHGRKELVHS